MYRGVAILLSLCLFQAGLRSQDLDYLDSLDHLLVNEHVTLYQRLIILKQLSEDYPDPNRKLDYSDQLILFATDLDSTYYIISGYLQKGTAHRLRGELTESLQSFFRASELALVRKLPKELGLSHIATADVYSIMNNHEDAIHYYQRGITILRSVNDSSGLAAALLNTGDEFLNHEKLDSALLYFKESGVIFDALKYDTGKAYNLGNLGMVYAKMGDTNEAEANINYAISILERLEDYYPICIYLGYMSDIYRDKKDHQLALKFARQSYDLAFKYGLKQEISDASLKMYELHNSVGDHKEGLFFYKNHVNYRDSVNNISEVQKTARLRADFEIAQKQLEVDLLTEQKQSQRISMIASIIAALSVALLALGLFMRYRYIYRTNQIIQAEKNRSDALLLNILPEETAQELKEHGKVKAKRFDSVTVMFTDFSSFTKYAENIPPEKLVQSVDYYFSKFDDIIGKYGLEKIKTVGDAYLCAGGLPYPTEDHAIKMISAARDILTVVEQAKEDQQNIITFDIRIGIHTGPVVAGVVGSKKFAYDIWGDTVNIASRMESNAMTNHINISQATYDLVKDTFNCQFRGDIQIKNRSNVRMYYIQEEIDV